jgi:nicotinamidase/pyrazinamidase
LLLATLLKVNLLEKEIRITQKDALIIIDVQKDFLLGGALPVPDGDEVIPVLNDYISLFKSVNAKVFATRDWHPPNHVSFKAFGGPWPPHCVQHTEGAEFHPDLKLPADVTVISKATDPERESYSGFDGTTLADELRKASVSLVFVGGLATDYCVRQTVLDGIALGFDMVLLLDAIRGINVKVDDSKKALSEMRAHGADTATLENFAEPSLVPLGQPEGESSAEKSLLKAETKKKARFRSRGPYRQTKTER